MILLIEKKKPAWQKGRINFIGGKIEIFDANPKQAAGRELFEEAGLMCPEADVTILGTIVGEGYIIYCCHCACPEEAFGRDNEVEWDKTPEKVSWYDVHDVLRNPALLPNLKILIPLMRHKIGGWCLEGPPHDTNNDHFTLRYPAPCDN